MGMRGSRVFTPPVFVPWRDVPQLAAGEVWIPAVGTSGTNPLLWSHGFDGGPQLIRLTVQARLHRPPVTFLNVSSIGPA